MMSIIRSFLLFFVAANSVLSYSSDPWLLTPGPITTSLSVKKSMLHDYGSRDSDFIRINREVLDSLLSIVNGHQTHVAVPLQGSGTFVVEAMLHTLVPHNGCLLILANGVYGRRMAKICDIASIPYKIIEFPENKPIDSDVVASYLSEHPEITHVATVHCETTTGMLNPIEKIAQVVFNANRKFLIDAISAFGALPLDSTIVPFDAVAISSNKCLQGVPGCAFCIIRKDSLQQAKNNARSLSLDLYDQWESMRENGQWRFTPPIQVIFALHKALQELQEEGGITVREKRYRKNYETLIMGMKRLGFELYLSENIQAPIITTFLQPNHPNFDFSAFYNRLKEKGFIIYPGKLTQIDTFRIGCIGTIDSKQIKQALVAIECVLHELNCNLIKE